MTSRRSLLIAGTGALAAGVAGRANGADPTPVSVPQARSPETTVLGASTPQSSPSLVAGGSFRLLGTQSLWEFLTAYRRTLPEGLEAANERLLPPPGVLAFCGATIWRDKYSLAVGGGHGDSYDNGHYVQDLSTGAWQALLGPSVTAGKDTIPDAFGEWAGRPASQHTYFHLVTVGDDIVLGLGGAVGRLASVYPQAHRWVGSKGAWERYGDSSKIFGVTHFVLYDAKRNRIYRVPSVQDKPVGVIAANDPTAIWQEIVPSAHPFSQIYQSVGFHVALDCFVMVDQNEIALRQRAWVMDPDNIAKGWVEVPVTGIIAPPMGNGGLEYVPPMKAFATANTVEGDALYYLTPTGGRLDAWKWTKEIFTGPVPPSPWNFTRAALLNPMSRIRWSELLKALVILKGPGYLTEVWTPRALGVALATPSPRALADWLTRSTAPGVLAAYDFSAPPGNGGDWLWGSLSANPKVTVEGQGQQDPQVSKNRFRDDAIFPPGSTASLRWDVPQGTSERSDVWRISIDNYADQIGAGQQVWIAWRTRMNKVMAEFQFADRAGPNRATTFKHIIFGQGMQRPNVGGINTVRKYYGYQGPGSSTDNVLQDARTDSQNDVVMISRRGPGERGVSTAVGSYGFKYPEAYQSKFYNSLGSRGQNINYGTHHNSGIESAHLAACQFTFDPDTYTDKNTCFIYPTDEWFSLMIHIAPGPYGDGISSLTGTGATGYTNSTVEYYGAYDGKPWQLLHRRTGIVLRTDFPIGPEGPQRYGTFGWTTFMTHKDGKQDHPTGKIWVSQIIVQKGASKPAAPV